MQGIGAAVIVVLLLVGGMWLYGEYDGGGAYEEGPGDEGAILTQDICDSHDNLNDIRVTCPNPINVSLHYEGSTLTVQAEDGEAVGSGTCTAGTTFTPATAGVPCDIRDGKIFALMSTIDTSQVGDWSMGTGTSDTVTLNVVPAGSLKIVALDSTFTNMTDTSTVDGGGAGCTETEADTHTGTDVGAGGSFQRYVDFRQTTAYHMYGSRVAGMPGILIGVDNQNASSWNKGDIKLSAISGGGNLVSVDCALYPNALAALDLDECWTMDSVASNDAIHRMLLAGIANGGNPFSDIEVHFIDLGYYQDTDGDIVYGGYNNARTSQGVATDCSLTVNLI